MRDSHSMSASGASRSISSRTSANAGSRGSRPATFWHSRGRGFPFTRDLGALLKARQVEHDRLKKAGHLCPFVFFREVADGRGDERKPYRIRSFTKAWSRPVVRLGALAGSRTTCSAPPSALWFAPAFRNG